MTSPRSHSVSHSSVPNNHEVRIIAAEDREESASVLPPAVGSPEAPSWGPFAGIRLPDGVLLQLAEPPVEIRMRHHVFLVDDELFDRAYQRLCERGIEHWADPWKRRPSGITSEHAGRGAYFADRQRRGRGQRRPRVGLHVHRHRGPQR